MVMMLGSVFNTTNATIQHLHKVFKNWRLLFFRHSVIIFFKNVPTSASFTFIFDFSNTHYKLFNTYDVKKCPSSIQCRDRNSRPLEHESPPITTWPGHIFIWWVFTFILVFDNCTRAAYLPTCNYMKMCLNRV